MKRIITLILAAAALTAAAAAPTDTERRLTKMRHDAVEDVYKAFRAYTKAKLKLERRLADAERLGVRVRLTADTLKLDTLVVGADTCAIAPRTDSIEPMPAPVESLPVLTPAKVGSDGKAVPKSDKSDPDAMAAEAQMYYLGDGRPQDYYKAFELYLAAADAGSSEGIFGTAVCYLEGHGTNRNYPAAVKWLTKGADAGDTDCMLLLGQCYEKGRGVTENVRRAVQLYREAASKGNAQAAAYLKRIGY